MNAIVETRVTNPSPAEIENRSKLLAEGRAALKKRYCGPNAEFHRRLDEAECRDLGVAAPETDLQRRKRLVEAALQTVWR